MTKQTTGEFLATLRKANGFTQADVAEKLNISNRTLSSWETDRTMPDVLILPALADLYGVTVDEILRGERAQASADNKADLSEKATKNMRKRSFGSFLSKYSILSGVAYSCAGLLVLTGILYLYSSSPLWLDILMSVLGGGGIITCIALCFYFANSVQVSEGIVLSDDVTEENKAFVFALKHKCAVLSARCSIVFWAFFTLLSLIFLMVNPTDVTNNFNNIVIVTVHVRDAYIRMLVINAFIALALFAVYFVCESINFKKYATEKLLERYNLNKPLVKKLFIFGGITLVVILIVCGIAAPSAPIISQTLALLAPLIIIGVCTLIYFLKRNKQNFNF